MANIQETPNFDIEGNLIEQYSEYSYIVSQLESGKAWRIGIFENDIFVEYQGAELHIDKFSALHSLDYFNKEAKKPRQDAKKFEFKLVEFTFNKS